MSIEKIIPNWSAPNNVTAFTTCRGRGRSQGKFAGLNLGLSSGDDVDTVLENRHLLNQELPQDPYFIHQVHSANVVTVDYNESQPVADASISSVPEQVCIVLTADCLPILLCAEDGREVAAIHAGWRSLAAGIIDETLAKMQQPAQQLMAWLGPAIGQAAFEVGPEVREEFCDRDPNVAKYFQAGKGDRLHADLAGIAGAWLQQVGLTNISNSNLCTYSDEDRFYSYRRDHETGRMASLIYFTSADA